MLTNQTSVDDNLVLSGTKDESSFRGTIQSISKLPWLTPQHKQKQRKFENQIEYEESKIDLPADTRNHIATQYKTVN